MPKDYLAVISGVKPSLLLREGEERDINSASSSSTYRIKRTFDHYFCTCPAWRNQGCTPVNARSCKHLRNLLGSAYEITRLLAKNPTGNSGKNLATKKSTAGSSSKSRADSAQTSRTKPSSLGKRKACDESDGDDAHTFSKKPTSKRIRIMKKSNNDDDTISTKSNSNDHDDDEDGQVTTSSGVPSILLAHKWDLVKGIDPTGWWMSEKLDGVRTFYDGKRMVSRLGNPFTPPQWFLNKLPKNVTLDGELFCGRGQFQSTVSIVKTINSSSWNNGVNPVTFQIFDIPSLGSEPFEERVTVLKKLFGPGGKWECKEVQVVEHILVKSRDHVLNQLKKIEGLGGEGLMLREPGSTYQGSRSRTLLKVKTFYDAEALVIGHKLGSGKNSHVTGALCCQMACGKHFNVGSGLTDKQRKNPPKIGAIIVYRFQEYTKDGIPRFPTFVGEAIDKKKPKDAVVGAASLAAETAKGSKGKSKAEGTDEDDSE